MKKNILLAVIFTLSASNVFGNERASIHLSNISQESLMLDAANVAVGISYPGRDVSGVCHLELVVSSWKRGVSLQELLEAIDIHPNPARVEVISQTVIRIGLSLGAYMDEIHISTKDGRSMKDVVSETLGRNQKLIIRPRSC